MTQSKSTKKKINELDFLKQIMGTYLQEMSHHLNALPYERPGTRHGHRNGYKPRHETRLSIRDVWYYLE